MAVDFEIIDKIDVKFNVFDVFKYIVEKRNIRYIRLLFQKHVPHILYKIK